jgi:hypothetical protein
MRWRWRSCDDTPSQDETVVLGKERQADDALHEARAALSDVREKKKDGSTIAQTLAAIRSENHFKDIWNQGLRGG